MAPLGNLVRLLPLDLNEVPTHSYLDPTIPAASSANNGKATANERPNLLSFIEEVLDQATTFAHDTLPATFRSKGNKTSKPAVAKVELLSRMIPSSDIEQVPWMNSSIPRNWSGNVKKKPREAWFARRSLHANASSEGTADLDEFDYGLRHNHSKHEQDYTPDVFDTYRVLDWSEQIAAELSKGHLIDGYSQVDMSSKYLVAKSSVRVFLVADRFCLKVHEMCHRLPAMLSNRVFPVLILTAKRGKHAFIVVQIPIDIRNLSESMYSNGRNQTMGGSKLKRQKPVLG